MDRSSVCEAVVSVGRFYIASGNCAHGVSRLPNIDYLRKGEIDKECPECAKHRKHVKLVETEGQVYECPECHYMHPHMARR